MHRFHQLLSPYFLKMLVELFDDIFNCHISEDDLKPPEYFLLKLLEESVIFVNLINFLAVKLPFYHIELLAGFFLILNLGSCVLGFFNFKIHFLPVVVQLRFVLVYMLRNDYVVPHKVD